MFIELTERRTQLRAKRSLGALPAPTSRTPHGNGAKIKLQGLVPILLLRRTENERFAALDACSLFVDVEILRYVMRCTILLTTDVASNCTPRELRLVTRVVLGPSVNMPVSSS